MHINMGKNLGKRIVIIVSLSLALVIAAGGFYSYKIYSKMFFPNVSLGDKEHAYIYIPTGSTYAAVISIIEESGYVTSIESFKWAASRMGYPYSVKSGRYKLANGTNNKDLVSILRAGLQTPVRVTFTGFRTPQQLAQLIANQIEVDSTEIANAFTDNEIPSQYGFNQQTFIAMFIPNTYEFFWNTNAKGFFDRMKREYENFWTDEKEQKAQDIGLSRVKVSTLASIVEEETIKADERQRVAGVYINRLKRGIPLQADPTIKYAMGNFTIRRILTKHLSIDSPYNTYKYRGLPPGPINSPSISSINAVLNYESHKYLYFCAKPDYSGYHAFAKTLSEHNKNAREYQRFLNKERIYR
ncbi:MAG TPA: endolytic transglycosylase MltG [Bacteroidales bacterium]|nr:endolytic transglycosylase MltG [Bacteroidales bacterium]